MSYTLHYITFLCRSSAHKIDLGEIIQFHFAFSCFGTLPAATSVLSEVRELWTRQSPAVANGTPYSLYEFPVNLQITSNTIALHLDSVLCLHVYLLPILDYLMCCRELSQEPPWAPVSEGVWVDGDKAGGKLQPLVCSNLADHSECKLVCLAFLKFLLLIPLPPQTTTIAPYTFCRKTSEQLLLSSPLTLIGLYLPFTQPRGTPHCQCLP